MIKSYLKTTRLWQMISRSEIYKKYRDPVTYNNNQVEPNFYKKLMRSHPAKNNLIFDVGANIGSKSRVFSKLAKKVIAFEPSEKLFFSLRKKFENTNVIIYNYALGERISTADFYIVESNEAYNSLNKKHIEETATTRGIASLQTVKHEKVKVEMLENFIAKYGIPKYIKIDVEGYELEVLKGLKTPAPLISLEANLPEFIGESIECLNYLDAISAKRYVYNFSVSNKFLKERFLNKSEAIDFLRCTQLPYLEIFARME